MKIFKPYSSGFTLVEMLVVIAIIAILTGIIVTDIAGSKAKSRDAERASDLAQIQLAIEQFFDRCDVYPVSPLSTSDNGTIDGVTYCPSGVTLENFISVIPTDPSGAGAPLGTSTYGYTTNYDTSSTLYPQPTDYVLYTKFEASNSVLSQSAPAPTSWTPSFPSGFSCTNATGLDYCVRPN